MTRSRSKPKWKNYTPKPFMVTGVRFNKPTKRAYFSFLKQRGWVDNVHNRLVFYDRYKSRIRPVPRYKGKKPK